MRWLFNFFDRRVTKQQRKELNQFLSVLHSMTDAEMAELVAMTAHVRHGFEQAGNNVLDPFTLWLKKPDVLLAIIKLVEDFQSKNNHAGAAAVMVWAHSIRAVSRSALLPLGQQMWQQLARGFDGVSEAKDEIKKRVGVEIDISDATKIPIGLIAVSS